MNADNTVTRITIANISIDMLTLQANTEPKNTAITMNQLKENNTVQLNYITNRYIDKEI